MSLVSREKWQSPESKGIDIFPWDISNLEHVLKQALAPQVTAKKQLWCAKVILRCVETTNFQKQVELRQIVQLAPTLRYLLTQSVLTQLGARLRQLVLSAYLYLLGGDIAFDEILIMDVDTIEALVAALRGDTHEDLRSTAVLVVRRISELPHLSSVLVFEETLFEVLLDLLELCQTLPQVTMHMLYLFVNLSGHPKLHFELARSRRVVFFAIETLLRVVNTGVVRRASKKVRRAVNSVSLSSFCSKQDETSPKRQYAHTIVGFSGDIRRAVVHMSVAVPCAMIIANLLSFQENRATMLSQYPDLLHVLDLCDSQEVSVRLWEIARCATNYLHEDEKTLETCLLAHLENS